MISNKYARLKTIGSFIQKNSVVADIGLDHGLLTIDLAKKGSFVYGIDISPHALEGAKSLLQSEIKKNITLRDKVILLEGNGLKPLIENDYKVSTIVLSGMGPNSVIKILTNNDETQLYEKRSKYDLSILDKLGIERIILQPWPPNILSNHNLNKTLLSFGWSYYGQGINQYGKYQHLTTCFIKSNNNINNNLNDELIFSMSPLAIRSSNKLIEKDEKNIWKDYLDKQRKTIILRLNNIKLNNTKRTNIYCHKDQETYLNILSSLKRQIDNQLKYL